MDWADLMLMRLLEKPDCEINSHLGKPFISHIEESDLSLGALHRAPVWASTSTSHGSNHLPLGGVATHWSAQEGFSSGERKDPGFPGRYLGILSVAVTKELIDTGKSNRENNHFLQFWTLHIELQGFESNENLLAQEGFQQGLRAVQENTREGVCFGNKAIPPSLRSQWVH